MSAAIEDRITCYLRRMGFKEGDAVSLVDRGFALAFMAMERRKRKLDLARQQEAEIRKKP